MNLFKRFIYYFIGLSLGSLIVYFIWTGKDVSFDYGMDARTLKTIRTKTLVYSEAADSYMKKFKIDSLAINTKNLVQNIQLLENMKIEELTFGLFVVNLLLQLTQSC